jgi:hypothetical protein
MGETEPKGPRPTIDSKKKKKKAKNGKKKKK